MTDYNHVHTKLTYTLTKLYFITHLNSRVSVILIYTLTSVVNCAQPRDQVGCSNSVSGGKVYDLCLVTSVGCCRHMIEPPIEMFSLLLDTLTP